MRDRTLDRRFERFRRKGDVAALGRVFDRTAPELLRVAMSLVQDPGEADDLLQATYLTAIERAERYDSSRRLVPWLLGILVNHAHEARRHRGARSEEMLAAVDAPGPDPSEAASSLELSELLTNALERLPAKHRGVLEPYLRDGKRAVDIARDTGQAPGTVRMQIHRGLDLLRRALPAGTALGAGVIALGGRGLAAVRDEVLREAAASTVALTAAGASATGVPLTTSTLGGLTVSKKASLAAITVLLAMTLTWLARPAFMFPDDSVESAPVVPVALKTAPSSSGDPGIDPVEAPVEAVDEGPVARGAVEEPPVANALAAFTGRILEHDGVPVVGVGVELFEAAPDLMTRSIAGAFGGGISRSDIVSARVTTDEEGRFTLANARVRALRVIGVDLGGQRSALRAIDVGAESGLTTDLGDIVLDPFGVLRGRILDADGEPVQGARVRAAAIPAFVAQLGLVELRPESELLLSSGGDPRIVLELPNWLLEFTDRLPVATTWTDAAGAFQLTHVAEGPVTLFVDKAGLGSSLTPISFLGRDANTDFGTITLGAGARVAGQVLDAAGNPVPEAEVLIGKANLVGGMSSAGFAVLHPAGRTDARGRFTLGGLPNAPNVAVAVRRSKAHPWTVAVADHDAGVEVRLPAALPLELVAIAADGAPVDALQIRVFGADFIPSAVVAMTGIGGVQPALESLGEGRFRTEPLPPGRYLVVGRSPKHGFAETMASWKEGSAVELRFLPRSPMRVRVRGEGGLPVGRALVSVHDLDQSGPSDGRALTDANGWCELSVTRRLDQERQRFALRVEHPEYAVAYRDDVQPGGAPVEVELDHGGNVELTIVSGGFPVSEPVMVIPRGALPTARGRRLSVHRRLGRGRQGDLPRLRPRDLQLQGDVALEGGPPKARAAKRPGGARRHGGPREGPRRRSRWRDDAGRGFDRHGLRAPDDSAAGRCRARANHAQGRRLRRSACRRAAARGRGRLAPRGDR